MLYLRSCSAPGVGNSGEIKALLPTNSAEEPKI